MKSNIQLGRDFHLQLSFLLLFLNIRFIIVTGTSFSLSVLVSVWSIEPIDRPIWVILYFTDAMKAGLSNLDFENQEFCEKPSSLLGYFCLPLSVIFCEFWRKLEFSFT
jgi:hypothetical protein